MRTSSSASRCRERSRAPASQAWRRTRSCSHSQTHGRRSTPRRSRPRRRHRYRPVRLPEPDQQRPRLPRRLPGRTGRAGKRDHQRDGARGRPRARRSHPVGPALRRLHHPQRLRPQRRAAHRARGGRGCSEIGGRQNRSRSARTQPGDPRAISLPRVGARMPRGASARMTTLSAVSPRGSSDSVRRHVGLRESRDPSPMRHGCLRRIGPESSSHHVRKIG